MKNLLELRDEIDVIDKQIVALYQQRMQIAAEVAEYKIETGKKKAPVSADDGARHIRKAGF